MMNSIISHQRTDYEINQTNDYNNQTLSYWVIEDTIVHTQELESLYLSYKKIEKKILKEYLKKNNQLKQIESFINCVSSNYDDIIGVDFVDDPENDVSKIFVLKIPLDTSSKDRMKLKSNIIDECIEYCEKNDLMDTFMDTAIFVRR